MNVAFIMIPLNVLSFTKLILIAHIRNILDSDGRSKYSYLFMFSMIVLSLSHASVVAEGEFLINKHLLSIHGNWINYKIIVAMRLVKDHLFKVGR